MHCFDVSISYERLCKIWDCTLIQWAVGHTEIQLHRRGTHEAFMFQIQDLETPVPGFSGTQLPLFSSTDHHRPAQNKPRKGL